MTIQEEGNEILPFLRGSLGGAIGATYVCPSVSSSGTSAPVGEAAES